MIPRRYRSILVIATLWFATLTAFVVHQSGWLQLAVVLLLFPYMGCLLSALVIPFRDWKTRQFHALTPLGACLVSLLGPYLIGPPLRTGLFYYHLSRYEAIVSRVERDPAFDNRKPATVSTEEAEKDLAYSVLAQKDANGILTVEFLTGGGFPVKHTGYVFSSTEAFPRESFIGQRWPYFHEVRPHWFRIAD